MCNLFCRRTDIVGYPGARYARVYFWLNGRDYSWMKVRSSIIRLVKLALQQQGFRMPPSIVREIAVLQGPSMTGLDGKPAATEGGADTLTGEHRPAEPAEETPDASPRKRKPVYTAKPWSSRNRRGWHSRSRTARISCRLLLPFLSQKNSRKNQSPRIEITDNA